MNSCRFEISNLRGRWEVKGYTPTKGLFDSEFPDFEEAHQFVKSLYDDNVKASKGEDEWPQQLSLLKSAL